jgi:hypothetical protein
VELEFKERTQFDGQSLHTADPVDALYFPATHAVHVLPSVPEKPPLQVQFIKAEFPADEKEFDGQAVHVEAPTVIEYVPDPHSVHRAAPIDALYFPAAHAEHVPPSGPEKPALQAQLVKTELPASELELDGQLLQRADPVDTLYFPATHTVQDASAVCPVASPYFPVPQAVQSPLPAADLYFPATHAMQVPPSGPEKPALQVQFIIAELPAGEL